MGHPFQNFMVRFKRGDTVFEDGDKGRTMFIVQAGVIGLYHRANGTRKLLGTLEKGDFFGEMSILEGLPRTMTARAEEDTELIEINHSVFDKMIRGNIEIAVRMLRKLSIRLREAEARIVELQVGGLRPVQRLRPRAGRARAAVCTGARLEAEGQDLVYPVPEPDALIGRFDPVTERRPDIDLTEIDLKRTISRQHARILKAAEGYEVIEEVGALNGTFVNDIKLTPGRRHPIRDGDRLCLGSVLTTFRA